MSNIEGRIHHRNPFLFRNWRTATDYLSQMGSKLSSPSHQPGDKYHGIDDDGYRPLKRRRIQDDPIGFPLYKPLPKEQQGSIDVIKINHKEGPRLKFNGVFSGTNPLTVNVSTAKARCVITISTYENGEQVPVFLDSQICTFMTFKSPVSSWPEARFNLEPFYVPKEKLCIPRDDGQGFALADAYALRIEFRPADDKWPPVDMVRRQSDDFFGTTLDQNPKTWSQSRKPARLKLRKQHQIESTTDFVLDMDARWCSRISTNGAGRQDKGETKPSITVVGTNEHLQQSPPESDGHADGMVNGAVHHTPNGRANGYVNEEDEELTPNRSRRTRTEINYNVRQMWNTAVGKEPRKRQSDHAITYILPMEQIQGDDFRCVLCGAVNHSVTQLRAHLDNHPKYLFDFDEGRKGNLQISVSHNPENPGAPLRPQVYSLGLPTKPFDFERFVEGDDSWITSRLGPDNGEDVEMTPKKVVVPSIKHPLFDPVSKVRLEPGSEYRPLVADDSWIIQKHRDTLMDFLDVEPGEKEYMREWDAYILQKHLTTDKYLPRAFLAFVRNKASWIIAEPHRAVEFGKHAAMLLARNAITEATYHDAHVTISEARAKPSTQEVPAQAEGSKTPPRGPDRCTVCKEMVPMPAMLVCANKICAHRLYHKSCVGEKVERGQKWLCVACREQH
ncbi:hypothetical protein GQ53DRAFT_778089 [Thozetella sp. PMI_491]|nr:hypothetical protein GQ53DRAFT_778089 [Thozetella sp. PMI_491]